ncbi:integral membrane protein GPR180 isoform X1 [Xyrichtys novacula]|uniref:Integral membrane protein GPR180 isoform X1 n=1 Tax=Xyrichtys novacula TaxID=13765 RepID=A0AAV1HN29_XYRNO|nr:integral membrane protein GPR180 isoform X1 [Xyrichtys novacula]
MYVFAVPLVLLLLGPGVSGKTVTGQFRSQAARQQSGQFISAFMFTGENSLLVCRLENPILAAEKESRLLLYQDWDSDLEKLSCSERLTRALFSISLTQDEHNLTIPRQSSPIAWMALYTDRYTCQDSVIPNHSDLTFTVLMLNPDSAGNPLDHFSAEEAGLNTFYFILLLSYFIVGCIYVQPLFQALRKGGPLHTALKVLTTVLALQGCSALCNYIHLARYSRDGVGIPVMGSLAECWDTVSQVSMLYLLLSLCLGWTLNRGRKPQCGPLQWEHSPASTAVAVGGVITQGVLLLWEQFSDSDHHSFHDQLSAAGLLLLALRVFLTLLLASVLYTITSMERSLLKRDFYLCFTKGCVLWFLCHPVLFLISAIFNEHQREKVVTMGVILCQSISMVILYQLFLSRSLYWEVSSLSSVSLPLTMSRSNHRGRY